jgi:hypothetical protein
MACGFWVGVKGLCHTSITSKGLIKHGQVNSLGSITILRRCEGRVRMKGKNMAGYCAVH